MDLSGPGSSSPKPPSSHRVKGDGQEDPKDPLSYASSHLGPFPVCTSLPGLWGVTSWEESQLEGHNSSFRRPGVGSAAQGISSQQKKTPHYAHEGGASQRQSPRRTL